MGQRIPSLRLTSGYIDASVLCKSEDLSDHPPLVAALKRLKIRTRDLWRIEVEGETVVHSSLVILRLGECEFESCRTTGTLVMRCDVYSTGNMGTRPVVVLLVLG